MNQDNTDAAIDWLSEQPHPEDIMTRLLASVPNSMRVAIIAAACDDCDWDELARLAGLAGE